MKIFTFSSLLFTADLIGLRAYAGTGEALIFGALALSAAWLAMTAAMEEVLP